MPIRSFAPPSAPAATQEAGPQPGTTDEALVAVDQEQAAAAQPGAPKKRAKRTKAQLIADAEIPADGTVFKMKDLATGSVVERAWPEAAQLFLSKSADFVDTADRYRALKLEKQSADASVATQPTQDGIGAEPIFGAVAQAAVVAQQRDEDPALEVEVLTQDWIAGQRQLDEAPNTDDDDLANRLEELRQQIIALGGQDPASDEAYAQRSHQPTDQATGSLSAPPDAQPGDEVRIGSETYRVGHGGILTTGVVGDSEGNVIKPYKRWQRELGAGKSGPWQATIVGQPPAEGIAASIFATPSKVEAHPATVPQASAPKPQIVRERSDVVEQVGLDVWKVGSGLLEKLGLPEYSALQIGPISASRQVLVTSDDRYTITRENGTKISAPREVVEAMVECGHAVEISARILRAEALSFIAAAKPGSVVQ